MGLCCQETYGDLVNGETSAMYQGAELGKTGAPEHPLAQWMGPKKPPQHVTPGALHYCTVRLGWWVRQAALNLCSDKNHCTIKKSYRSKNT